MEEKWGGVGEKEWKRRGEDKQPRYAKLIKHLAHPHKLCEVTDQHWSSFV